MFASKIIGYLLIMAGSSGMGLWYSMRMQQKVWHMEEMIRILDMVVSEIDYGRSTLPDCYAWIKEKTHPPYQKIFQKIWESTQDESGQHIGRITEKILEQELQSLPLGEEKDIFTRCFSDVGYADEWLQRRNIERGRERLQSLLDKEEEDLKKRSKLAVSLGTMSGILLVLILL